MLGGHREESGRGFASLHTGLEVAGARWTVTSLWKMPDVPTRQLMVEFYKELWVEDLEPPKALWQAKAVLRKAGAPHSHWAGWLLTGI